MTLSTEPLYVVTPHGHALLRKAMIEQKINTPVVMVSGHGDVHTAVECTKRGAFDFLEKPLNRDKLLLTVRNAVRQR